MVVPCLSLHRHFHWHLAGNTGLTQAAGIGGGPIINICLIIGLGYETKASMAITYIFLLGGSTASIYSNYGKKIGTSNRNAIDTNLVIMTLPMTVSGSIFGVLLYCNLGIVQPLHFRTVHHYCLHSASHLPRLLIIQKVSRFS